MRAAKHRLARPDRSGLRPEAGISMETSLTLPPRAAVNPRLLVLDPGRMLVPTLGMLGQCRFRRIRKPGSRSGQTPAPRPGDSERRSGDHLRELEELRPGE